MAQLAQPRRRDAEVRLVDMRAEQGERALFPPALGSITTLRAGEQALLFSIAAAMRLWFAPKRPQGGAAEIVRRDVGTSPIARACCILPAETAIPELRAMRAEHSFMLAVRGVDAWRKNSVAFRRAWRWLPATRSGPVRTQAAIPLAAGGSTSSSAHRRQGYHFPQLTLAGIIDADLGGGGVPRRRRTFQLLHQVAGRSGRGKAFQAWC